MQTATTWEPAWVACINSFGNPFRLPTTGELLQVLDNEANLSSGTENETDWTDDTDSTGNATTVTAIGFAVGNFYAAQSSSVTYRCVTPAHTNLGPTPTAPPKSSGAKLHGIGK